MSFFFISFSLSLGIYHYKKNVSRHNFNFFFKHLLSIYDPSKIPSFSRFLCLWREAVRTECSSLPSTLRRELLLRWGSIEVYWGFERSVGQGRNSLYGVTRSEEGIRHHLPPYSFTKAKRIWFLGISPKINSFIPYRSCSTNQNKKEEKKRKKKLN